MKLYTGTVGGDAVEAVRRLGLGVMVSGDPTKMRELSTFYCAIDNGAYEAWRRGLPWSGDRFLRTLDKCWDTGISADFVVCPDIVGKGMDSFDFSMSWVDRLRPAHLALAVQDGMGMSIFDHNIHKKFTHIFVGGTTEWKWARAKEWVVFAHGHGMKCHIGRCGTLDNLRYADRIGADSVDSTSWARNQSWHIVEEYLHPLQVNCLDSSEHRVEGE